MLLDFEAAAGSGGPWIAGGGRRLVRGLLDTSVAAADWVRGFEASAVPRGGGCSDGSGRKKGAAREVAWLRFCLYAGFVT